jgi:hypothetical protein
MLAKDALHLLEKEARHHQAEPREEQNWQRLPVHRGEGHRLGKAES